MASPVSPQPSAVLVAGTVLHSHHHRYTPRRVLSDRTTSCPATLAAPSCSCQTARVASKNHTVLGRTISSSCHRLIRHKG